jgi:hypothetical protein
MPMKLFTSYSIYSMYMVLSSIYFNETSRRIKVIFPGQEARAGFCRKTPAKITGNGSSIATGKSPDFTW